jgi:hypothetical protein
LESGFGGLAGGQVGGLGREEGGGEIGGGHGGRA